MSKRKHKLIIRNLGLILLALFFFLLFNGCSYEDTNSQSSTEISPQVTDNIISQVTQTPLIPESSSTPDTYTEKPEDSSFEVHFIDVGQGDSALILCDGKAMLIDGGNSADSNLIYAYLKTMALIIWNI